MKKSLLVILAMLLFTTSTLSGCIWRVEDDGHYRGGHHERDRGEHHGDHHERHDDRGDRR